jgi:hypothetical protein
MSDQKMVPIDRVEYCVRCHIQTTHQWRVYTDVTYKKCTRCSLESTVEYTQTSSQLGESNPLDALDHVSEELNNIGGSMINHKWSKNLPDKDRNFIKTLLGRIFGVKQDVDKLRRG